MSGNDFGAFPTHPGEVLNLLEAAPDIPAALILKLQMRYDMQMAQSDQPFMERLAAIRKLTAVL